MTAVSSALRITWLTATGPVESNVSVTYNPDRPYEITAVFAHGDRVVEWALSRELLVSGYITRVGLGDARIQPRADGHLRITLTTDSGHGAFDIDGHQLAAFLGRTFDLVPLGREISNPAAAGLLDGGAT